MKTVAIRSQTSDATYQVALDDHGFAVGCTCPAGQHHRPCWHLKAVELRPIWLDAANRLAQVLGKETVLRRFDEVKAVKGTLEAIADTIEVCRLYPFKPSGPACFRCGGEGWIQRFVHVEGGICFRCNGTGVDPVPERRTDHVR